LSLAEPKLLRFRYRRRRDLRSSDSGKRIEYAAKLSTRGATKRIASIAIAGTNSLLVENKSKDGGEGRWESKEK